MRVEEGGDLDRLGRGLEPVGRAGERQQQVALAVLECVVGGREEVEPVVVAQSALDLAADELPVARQRSLRVEPVAGSVAEGDADVDALARQEMAAGRQVQQLQLGDLYSSGRGLAVDVALANAWYEKAAEQGNAGAAAKLRRSNETRAAGEPTVRDIAHLMPVRAVDEAFGLISPRGVHRRALRSFCR